MIPLATHQRVWSWLCVESVESGTQSQKNHKKMFAMFAFMAHVAVIMSSAAFVMEYARTDLSGSLHALLHLTAFVGMAYVLVIAFMSRDKITAIFENSVEIYTKCKNSAQYFSGGGFSLTFEWNRMRL